MEPVGYHPETLRCIPAFQLISHWKTHSQLSLSQITRTALGPAWTATLLLRNHSTNSFQPGSGHPPSGTPRLNCSHSGWSSLNQLTMPPTELFHQSGRKMCSVHKTPYFRRKSPALWYVTQGGDGLLAVFLPFLLISPTLNYV